MSFSITFDIRDFNSLDMIEEMLRRAGNLKPLLRSIGQAITSEAHRSFDRGGPEGRRWKPSRRASQGGQTLVASGRLRRSVHYKVRGRNSVAVGSNVRYAAIHHFGGIIRPRRAQALAVPIGDIRGRPGDFDNTFIRQSDGGGKKLAIIYQRTGRGKVRPLFVLLRSVTIPARPFVVLGRRLRNMIGRLTSRHMLGR